MTKHRKSSLNIDKALLEAAEIDKAFEANAKEILAHTMSSEIEEMVRESLEGSMVNEYDEEMDLEVSDESDIDDAGDGDDLTLSLDMDDMDLDGDNEEDLDIDLDLDIDDDADFDLGDDDVETIDLTGSNDTDVITVFKKMGPDDEIEVVQDGDSVDIKDTATGAEYRVELGGGNADMDMDLDLDDTDEFEMDLGDDDMDLDMDLDDDDALGDFDLGGDDDMDYEDEDDEFEMDDDMTEEVVYEIEITDDGDDMSEEDETLEDEDEIEEASRTLGSGRKWGKGGLNKPRSAPRHLNRESVTANSKVIQENKVLKSKLNNISSENNELKGDYNKLVEALKGFRKKLDEVAIFNSNLTYAVRLFTENTTSKDEKFEIIKRFDEVKSLKESKNMYKNLVKEISKTKTPIKESIEDKINETKGSGSKTQISESKVYVHPELAEMKKLWEFNYKY